MLRAAGRFLKAVRLPLVAAAVAVAVFTGGLAILEPVGTTLAAIEAAGSIANYLTEAKDCGRCPPGGGNDTAQGYLTGTGEAVRSGSEFILSDYPRRRPTLNPL